MSEAIRNENKKPEKHEFGVEVPQLMSMFINSVYSSKDLFLREAVSNASDACKKLFDSKAQFDKEGYETVAYNALKIEIVPDKDNRTLVIRDNGIGMTKDDLRNYLGSIAASGTALFREMQNKAGAQVDDLIGQFGLGFYSLFLVAQRVDVVTKSPRDSAYVWSSDGSSGYTIEECDSFDGKHGTAIYLRLKDGEDEFLDSNRLIELVKKHSMYIRYPIAVECEKKPEKKEKENGDVEEVEEVKDKVDEIKEKEMKIANSDVEVWNKKISDIPEEDLKKFYKQISGDYDDYLAAESFHLEGIVGVKVLLFIPKRQRMNFFQKQDEKARNIQIYNSSVFITDVLPRDVVPEWMGFVVGAVSSSDFSLNISREFLQGKTALKILRTRLPKCIATMIKNLSQENFDKFVVEFSRNLKLAVKDTTDQVQTSFAQFLRYPTNQNPSEKISLNEYCNRIGKEEKQILVQTALTQKEAETSIYLDGFKDRTVLLMGDPFDEIMLQGYRSHNGLEFQNIAKEGVLGEDGTETKAEEFDGYADFSKEIVRILEKQVEKVIVSKRFKGVPASILITKYGYTPTMETILKANSSTEHNMMLQMLDGQKKIVEINPENRFIQKIKGEFDKKNATKVEEYVRFLWQSTAIGCGFPVEDKNGFIRTMYELME
ncbi:HSP82 [Enterospora canceri]|uniref:HSP82 n=1 Tax=Enterospora canceri TaxID=1081671 RepID=A0A1Y1S6H9_9MICR|nr:HSP82 [Enterospora canceri]